LASRARLRTWLGNNRRNGQQRTPKRVGRGESEKTRARHAMLFGMPIDALDPAPPPVDVHALRGVTRRHADNEVGHEVAALGQHDPLDRRRLRKWATLLHESVDGLRQCMFRLLYGLFVRPPTGYAAWKVREPRAECSLRTALQHCRVVSFFHLLAL